MTLNGLAERIFAGRWIAGATIEDAIKRAKELNGRGAGAIINYLGEDFASKKDVDEAVSTYKALIDRIAVERLDAAISMKVTQLGFAIDPEVAYANYNALVDAAREKNVFAWLDMEGSDTIEGTIKAYAQQAGKGGTGVAIQAYLKRSMYDLSRVVSAGGRVRLVKGAYKEKPIFAYKSKKDIDGNYNRMLQYLFDNADAFTVATHDSKFIELSIAMNEYYKKKVTYAMLNGIRNGYAYKLAKSVRMELYLPFGARWIDYSYRRLREAGHAMLILRSLL